MAKMIKIKSVTDREKDFVSLSFIPRSDGVPIVWIRWRRTYVAGPGICNAGGAAACLGFSCYFATGVRGKSVVRILVLILVIIGIGSVAFLNGSDSTD